eukprot:scaffold563_cov410-Prasinococcus_capsulatus_cf.AAC.14
MRAAGANRVTGRPDCDKPRHAATAVEQPKRITRQLAAYVYGLFDGPFAARSASRDIHTKSHAMPCASSQKGPTGRRRATKGWITRDKRITLCVILATGVRESRQAHHRPRGGGHQQQPASPPRLSAP